MSEKQRDKGDLQGECNRTACENKNAVYYNHSTEKYYCWYCAGLINDLNMSDALRMYGHELCQHFSQINK
jgi:hypothetical protein